MGAAGVLVFFIVVLIVVFVFGSHVRSWQFGWPLLASRFRDRSGLCWRAYRWSLVGWSMPRFRGAPPVSRFWTGIAADESGLHLRLFPPLSWLRRSVLVPWDTVDARGTYSMPLWYRVMTLNPPVIDCFGIGFVTEIGVDHGSATATLIANALRTYGSPGTDSPPT